MIKAKPVLMVHAGLHKTGTSYIQRVLHQNSKALAERGVLYPWCPAGKENHAHLVAWMRGGAADKVLASLQKFSQATQPVVLISSEDLSTEFNHPDRVALFLEMCGDLFSGVKFIYYLRRVDEMWESVFAQIVKGWYQGSIYSNPRYKFDPAQRLGPLIRAVGHGAIILRPYNRQLWAENDIALDCLHAAGLTDLTGLEIPPSVNTSLPRRKTLFLSQVDKTTLSDKAAFVAALHQSEAIADDGIRYVTSPEARSRFYDSYRPYLEVVLRQFGIEDVDGFLGYSPPCDKWELARPVTAQEVAALRAEMQDKGFEFTWSGAG